MFAEISGLERLPKPSLTTGSSMVAHLIAPYGSSFERVCATVVRAYCSILHIYDASGLVCAIRWLVRWKPGRMNMEGPTS